MTKETEKSPWEQRLREAAARAEEEAKRVAAYIHDEVVPDIRTHSSLALHFASDELKKLAQRLDEHNAAAIKDRPKK